MLHHRYEVINGLRFHWVEAGEGPTVLFLHGFPEFWYAWRHQLPAFASAGFRAVAPDLRGYNETEKPKAVANYRGKVLVEDIHQLIRHLGNEPVYLVGHDWGGVLAWRCASLLPHLIGKLAILNGPHPAARQAALRKRPWLWLRSAYMFFFQLRRLPEAVLVSQDFALFERMWRRQPVHAGTFSDVDIAAYKEALRRPNGLNGPLNYYRAAFRYSNDLLGSPQAVSCPTHILWAEKDPYLAYSLIEDVQKWVPRASIIRVPDSSHWIQNDVPDRVNRELIAFFQG